MSAKATRSIIDTQCFRNIPRNACAGESPSNFAASLKLCNLSPPVAYSPVFAPRTDRVSSRRRVRITSNCSAVMSYVSGFRFPPPLYPVPP